MDAVGHLACLGAVFSQNGRQAAGHKVHLFGVAAHVVDSLGVVQVKAKELVVQRGQLVVKMGLQVGRGKARLKHAALPFDRGHLVCQVVQAALDVAFLHEAQDALELKLALLGASHGEQAVLAQLAGLYQAVHRVGQNVDLAQRRGGVQQGAQVVGIAAALLLGLPGGDKKEERPQAAQVHAKSAQGLDVGGVGEKRVAGIGQLDGHELDLGVDLGHSVPGAGVGAGHVPAKFARGLGAVGQRDCHDRALVELQLRAAEVVRHDVHEGGVAHDHQRVGLYLGSLEVGQKRGDVLVVKALVNVDAAGVHGLGHDARRLQGADRGAAPDADLGVLAQKLESARIGDL